MSGYPPEVPGVTATGVQRALGERRRRRMAERGGHVDLDATMSSWPTPDPPTRPRPVVRPRRMLPGGGDRPVLPTPSALVMADLAEHAPSPSPGDTSEGSRRSRRGDTGAMSPVRPTHGAEAPVTAAPTAGDARGGATAAAGDRVAEPQPARGRGAGASGADPFARKADRAKPSGQPFTQVPPPERPTFDRGPGGDRPAVPGVAARGTNTAAAATRRPPTSAETPFDGGQRMQPGAAASVLGTLPGMRRSSARADALTEEPPERSSGRRTLLIVGAVVATLAIIAVAVFALRGQSGSQAALLPANDAARQTTALVSVLADDGTIAQSALLALDEDSLCSMAVPGSLVVDVAGSGEMTLAESVKVDPDAPDRGVEDTLGVRVDGTWVLDRAVLAELVDATGGIVLDVGSQIIAGDVTVPAGPAQRLLGSQAGVYALAAVDGETPDVAVAKFNQVILALLAAMPTDPDRVTQLISATERNTATTITSEQLSALIAGASERIAADSAIPATVPLVAAPDGGQSSELDVAGMQQLIAGDLAGSELPVATVGPLRVMLQNAVGTEGLEIAARDRLVAGGFRYGGGGDSEDVGAAESAVLVPSDTPENRDRGEAVATALGLNADSLAVLPPDQGTIGVDIIVVLGQDFADLTGSGPT